MIGKLKIIFVAVPFGLMLGGCSELTQYFAGGDPSQVSSCATVSTDLSLPPEALCVECNSVSKPSAEVKACGRTLKAKCSSTLGVPVFGIALVATEGEPAAFLTGTAWMDDDGAAGPSADDQIICHEQSLDLVGKQEWKCAAPPTGKGKDLMTFEASSKYDPAKDTCI